MASIRARKATDSAMLDFDMLPLLVSRSSPKSTRVAGTAVGDASPGHHTMLLHHGGNVNDTAVRSAASGSVQCFVQLLVGLTGETMETHSLGAVYGECTHAVRILIMHTHSHTHTAMAYNTSFRGVLAVQIARSCALDCNGSRALHHVLLRDRC